MAKRTYVYAAAAVVLAGLAWLLVSPYGVLQAIMLSILLLAIAADALSKTEREPYLEPYPSSLRSRIAHYSRIARVTDSADLRRTAANPFELALLNRPDWSDLSEGDLRELGVKVRNGADSPLPRPVPGHGVGS
jgi:hypothetical protein